MIENKVQPDENGRPEDAKSEQMAEPMVEQSQLDLERAAAEPASRAAPLRMPLFRR